MIDKRTNIGKMIDNDRIVYECITCRYRYIGGKNNFVGICPSCKRINTIVIVDNRSVINK